MKVLVAAASRHGSTEMIADCIREELEFAGCQAYLVDPDTVTSLAEFDAVVLGSAVYTGRWLKPARRLVDRLETELRRKPVWLFSSGPVGTAAPPAAKHNDGIEIAARIEAREHRVFAGRLAREQLGFVERFVLRAVKAEDGDDRDWLEIGRWARSIGAELRAQATAGAGSAAAVGSAA